MPVFEKHAPYISMDKKGNFILENEAHYISGILNTNIVGKYFEYIHSLRSYSINFNIKIPKYDEKNKSHKSISELAKKAVESDNKESIIDEIEKIYLDMCK